VLRILGAYAVAILLLLRNLETRLMAIQDQNTVQQQLKPLSFPVVLYTGQTATPGYEVIRFITRVTDAAKKAGKKEVPTTCISVPKITYTDVGGPLASYIMDALSDLRAALMRSLVDAGAVQISEDQIGIQQMQEFYTAKTASNRLTKEAIQQWVAGLHEELWPGMDAAARSKREVNLLCGLETLAATMPALSVVNARLLLARVMSIPESKGGPVQASMIRKLDKIINPPADKVYTEENL
jgi:hypothetical protein